MEEQLNRIIPYLVETQAQTAAVLFEHRQVAAQLAQYIATLPDGAGYAPNPEVALEDASLITASVVSYLQRLAELQDVLAETIRVILQDNETDSEEE